jgi:predicted ribosomally synthesized peptide with nif11-like leader
VADIAATDFSWSLIVGKRKGELVADQVDSWRAVLHGSPELLAKVHAASSNEEVTLILAEAGLQVSVDEVLGALVGEAGNADDALSDEELQAATGGRRNVVQGVDGRFAPGV